MAREPVTHTIRKVDQWPLSKQREYLRLAFETERDARRRRAISKALRDVTTKVLRRSTLSRSERETPSSRKSQKSSGGQS